MAKRTIVKSDAQTDEFELDQEAIDAVNAEEGFGEDISDSDVKDALVAIAAIADQVIEEGEELEPEQVVEKVAEIVEGDDFEPEAETEEVEVSEEEEMPEELNNALVRVMVQEGDEVEIDGSTVEDEIRQETIDGETATVFDTVSDSGDSFEEMDFAEDSDEADEGLIVVGNSLVKNPSYKKGFVTLKNSVQKKVGKCWSAAYKKVRAMIGSRKMNAKDWAIVSCLALSMSKKEKVASAAKANNMKRVMTAVKNNADFKKEFTNMIGSGCHGKKKEKKVVKSSLNDELAKRFLECVNNGECSLDYAGADSFLRKEGYEAKYANEILTKAEEMSKQVKSSRRTIKSELTDEIEQSTETEKAEQPEETVATDFGKVDTNPDFAEGEVVEPYGDDPEDLIEPGAEDVVEVAVPLESSTRRIVLKKIMNSVYKVVGTRLTSRRLVNRRPLKSGTVICLKNGKAILLKNSNTAGMLAFYGKLIKSSSKAPYCAVKAEDGVYITQNKKGSDMFALAEKKCLMNSIANARKVQSSRVAESRLARRRSLMNNLRNRKAEALKSARLARLEKIRNSRVASSELKNEKLRTLKNSRLIQSKNEQISALKSELVKAKIQAIKSRKDSQKVTEMAAKQERDRLFQSNKEQLKNIAKVDQINSSKNVDTMASMLDRMF